MEDWPHRIVVLYQDNCFIYVDDPDLLLLPETPGSAGPADPEAQEPDLRHHSQSQWSTTSYLRVSLDESEDPSDETFDVKEELVLMILDISVNFVTHN